MGLIQAPNRQFVDDGRHTPGTPAPTWWLSQLQGKLCSILDAVGIEPNKADYARVLSAIKTSATNASQVANIDAPCKYSGIGYVNVNAYHANTIVSGGVFVMDKADKSITDNGYTVTVSTGGTRQRRMFSGMLNLHGFGYMVNENDALATLNVAETATLGIVADCLGLSIDTGSSYPQKNKCTNGKFVINGKTIDVQYQAIRNGIDRFIAGNGAAASLKSGE